MRFQLMFIVVTIFKHQETFANLWQKTFSEENVYIQGHNLAKTTTNSIFECYAKCHENPRCASINMDITDKTCELKDTTKKREPSTVSYTRENVLYMELRDQMTPSVKSSPRPVKTCKELSNVKSGVYWIQPDNSQKAFQVYCEMETDGGGWTLVYSYNFTNYNSFTKSDNAVSPRPHWPVPWAVGSPYSPFSSTVPLSNNSYSAMDFKLWKTIGNEFLLASNIMDWYSCVEGDGSLVNFTSGSITCKRAKTVIPTASLSCTPQVPVKIDVRGECSPDVEAPDGSKMIKWESKTDGCTPFHDPCGTNDRKILRFLLNVAEPGGQIYIR